MRGLYPEPLTASQAADIISICVVCIDIGKVVAEGSSMGSIIVTSGKQKGEYLPLGKRTSVIGRDEALPLQLLDALVSRKHLRIWFEKATGRYYAEDLQSKHGVFINGRRITDDVALTDGDEILIGDTMLLYTDEELDSRESALSHFKKRGQRIYQTRTHAEE